MSNSKFYVVKVGRKPGIYKNWTECKKQVDGFSGAVYKSFLNIVEAEAYLWGTKLENEKRDVIIDSNELYAYVDGSYSDEFQTYSYGCVIIRNNQIVQKLSGNEQKSEYIEMRNVAGELLGAMNAVKWAIEKGYPAVKIFHDYEGIARWPNNEWKANKEGTKEYVEFIKNSRKVIEISFEKVKGHSGDTYNDMADMLAKDALKVNMKKDLNQDDKYRKLLLQCISQSVKTKAKVRVSYSIDEHLFSEKQIEVFIFKYMEEKGILKDEISYISVILDMNCKALKAIIVDKGNNKKEFTINL